MPGMTSVSRKGRRDFELTNCLNETGADCRTVKIQLCVLMGSNSHASAVREIRRLLVARPVLTNRVREYFTHGSVGGVGRKPGPYPAANPAIASRLQSNALVGRVAELLFDL
jgi:hypothetical protein